MKHHWIRKEGNGTLAVFMLGWAADHNMLGDYPAGEGCDMVCFYDYRDMGIDQETMQEIKSYPHRKLTGWSFGVWAAEEALGNVGFDSAEAINGTPLPVDETYGIPPRNFAVTVRGIESAGGERFVERMCGDRLGEYLRHPSLRSDDDISSELRTLAEHFERQAGGGSHAGEVKEQETDIKNELLGTPARGAIRWDRAVIGLEDRIFPPEAQRKYWQRTETGIIEREGMPHYFR